MEFVKANPDIETLKIILWMAGGLITLLIGVIISLTKVYFAGQKKRMEHFEIQQDSQNAKFTSLVDSIEERQNKQYEGMVAIVGSLRDTVNELKRIVGIIQDRQMGDGKYCQERHKSIDIRLKDHGDQLDKHEHRITKVETKIEKQ